MKIDHHRSLGRMVSCTGTLHYTLVMKFNLVSRLLIALSSSLLFSLEMLLQEDMLLMSSNSGIESLWLLSVWTIFYLRAIYLRLS